jgi:hypothetical protein
MEIPDEKIAMIAIIMSLENFTDPVAMQSISDAAMQRKKELEQKLEKTKEAKKLWAELGDIPLDSYNAIEVDWHIFDQGTEQTYIWHWFEETFDISVGKDLMGM